MDGLGAIFQAMGNLLRCHLYSRFGVSGGLLD